MVPPAIEPSRIFRTPEDRFARLPDFPYTPLYATFGNLRYAFLDLTGPIIDTQTGQTIDKVPDGHTVQTETVLCLHGEPTWSYLYRKMIPGFLGLDKTPLPRRPHSGQRYIQRRVVVPDFIGFGRSDKPIDDEYYTWDAHRNWLIHFVNRHLVQDPRTAQGGRVTLVVQDWGGLLGLILPNTFPALFTHLLVMNTGLGLGRMPSKGWVAFRDFVARSPDLDVGALIGRGTPLSTAEIDAYRAPYSTEASKAGVRRFPQLVPVDPSMRGVADSTAALAFFRALPSIAYTSNACKLPAARQSQGVDINKPGVPLQVFVCVGKADPVLGMPVMEALAKKAWGESCGYWWHVIDDAGHFVQEWAAHLPALSDLAWSQPPQDKIEQQGQHAKWVPARAPSKM